MLRRGCGKTGIGSGEMVLGILKVVSSLGHQSQDAPRHPERVPCPERLAQVHRGLRLGDRVVPLTRVKEPLGQQNVTLRLTPDEPMVFC